MILIDPTERIRSAAGLNAEIHRFQWMLALAAVRVIRGITRPPEKGTFPGSKGANRRHFLQGIQRTEMHRNARPSCTQKSALEARPAPYPQGSPRAPAARLPRLPSWGCVASLVVCRRPLNIEFHSRQHWQQKASGFKKGRLKGANRKPDTIPHGRWRTELPKWRLSLPASLRIPPFACIMRAHAARRKFCVQEILHAEFACHGAWHGM